MSKTQKKATDPKAKKAISKPAVKTVKKAAKKAILKSLPKTESADEYMSKLKHPLKEEIEAVRLIIKKSNKGINERVKWNAPSYYYKEDLVTFNTKAQELVHLVFHHPSIETIKSPILEGEYKGRRMTYFRDMKEVKAKKKELEKVINELIKRIE